MPAMRAPRGVASPGAVRQQPRSRAITDGSKRLRPMRGLKRERSARVFGGTRSRRTCVAATKSSDRTCQPASASGRRSQNWLASSDKTTALVSTRPRRQQRNRAPPVRVQAYVLSLDDSLAVTFP